MCEYRLALVRVRGRQPGDSEFISDEYLSLFGKGSVPEPDPGRYPDPEELRRVLNRVHEHTLSELADLPDTILDEPSEPRHPMFRTKLGALGWCAQHEFLHAGQIGLLRRLLGSEPLR